MVKLIAQEKNKQTAQTALCLSLLTAKAEQEGTVS